MFRTFIGSSKQKKNIRMNQLWSRQRLTTITKRPQSDAEQRRVSSDWAAQRLSGLHPHYCSDSLKRLMWEPCVALVFWPWPCRPEGNKRSWLVSTAAPLFSHRSVGEETPRHGCTWQNRHRDEEEIRYTEVTGTHSTTTRDCDQRWSESTCSSSQTTWQIWSKHTCAALFYYFNNTLEVQPHLHLLIISYQPGKKINTHDLIYKLTEVKLSEWILYCSTVQ